MPSELCVFFVSGRVGTSQSDTEPNHFQWSDLVVCSEVAFPPGSPGLHANPFSSDSPSKAIAIHTEGVICPVAEAARWALSGPQRDGCLVDTSPTLYSHDQR